MSDNTKILFGIFCLMLTLVFLYTLTALGFNGNDSAFIILVFSGNISGNWIDLWYFGDSFEPKKINTLPHGSLLLKQAPFFFSENS